MTSVAVVVGHSRHDDAHRLANLAWVVARYQAHDYPVAVGAAVNRPWVKAHAFNPTAATVDADVLVIADADCIVTRGALAATVTAAARDGYAVPAKAVHRLTPRPPPACSPLTPATTSPNGCRAKANTNCSPAGASWPSPATCGTRSAALTRGSWAGAVKTSHSGAPCTA